MLNMIDFIINVMDLMHKCRFFQSNLKIFPLKNEDSSDENMLDLSTTVGTFVDVPGVGQVNFALKMMNFPF